MYIFRGYNPDIKRMVIGKSINQTEFSVKIHSDSTKLWSYVDPKSLGIRAILKCTVTLDVYQGDIIRYTFTDHGEVFNRYYIVKQDNCSVYCEELWRDYHVNCETFEVSRLHSVVYRGERKDLTDFTIRNLCKVIGNIWENPELIEEEK